MAIRLLSYYNSIGQNPLGHRGKPLRTALRPRSGTLPLSRSVSFPPLRYAPKFRSVPDYVLHYAISAHHFVPDIALPLSGRPLEPAALCSALGTNSSVKVLWLETTVNKRELVNEPKYNRG